MTRRTWSLLAAMLVLCAGVASAAAIENDKEKERKEAEAKLLPLGQVAPDFTLPLATGGEVTLANLLKFGKAVLVGFWTMEPEAGGEALPKLQKLHEKWESKGLSTICINPEDKADKVKRFVEAEKLHFMVAIDGKETNSAVTDVYRAAEMLPVFYLLNTEGKVLWRAIGLDEKSLTGALEKAGLK
jgi:peroxiredoxin